MHIRIIECAETTSEVEIAVGSAVFVCLNCRCTFGHFTTEIPPCDICGGTSRVERCFE